MRIYPDKLDTQLQRALLPIYLVYGEEPQQAQSCCDAIRAAARAAGHLSREVIDIDGDADWQALGHAADAMSLFAERRLIDLRLPSGKPGRVGGEAIRAWCERPAEDTVLLISAGKIDSASTRSAWFKAIDKLGAVIAVWPLQGRDLLAWIDARMRAAGLQSDRAVVSLIAERVEGNLLAARQEIDKLALLFPGGAPGVEDVLDAVVDSSRFGVFDLSGALLAGCSDRVWHILGVLRGEGVDAAPVLWAVHRELRDMAAAAAGVARGQTPQRALGDAGVAPFRQKAMAPALRRHRAAGWQALSARCAELDLMAKGRADGDIWLALAEVCLAATGRPLPLIAAGRPR